MHGLIPCLLHMFPSLTPWLGEEEPFTGLVLQLLLQSIEES